jgi:general secretion pathway protein H
MSSARERLQGFSLIEMLVVLAIIGLVVAIALPYYGGVPDQIRLRATTQSIVTAMKSTRAAAIAQDAEMALVFDMGKRTFSSPAVAAAELPKDVQIDLTIAALAGENASRGSIRFFPDGSSTGGDISLMLHNVSSKICTNWLSGVPQEGSSCR